MGYPDTVDAGTQGGRFDVLTLRAAELLGPVSCPYCGSEQTAPTGLFASTLSEIPMWCSGCSSSFSCFRWRKELSERLVWRAGGRW